MQQKNNVLMSDSHFRAFVQQTFIFLCHYPLYHHSSLILIIYPCFFWRPIWHTCTFTHTHTHTQNIHIQLLLLFLNVEIDGTCSIYGSIICFYIHRSTRAQLPHTHTHVGNRKNNGKLMLILQLKFKEKCLKYKLDSK